MKTGRWTTLVAALSLGMAFAAAPGNGLDLTDMPRFNGYIGTGGETRFALTAVQPDGTPGKLSWIKVGEQFGKYDVVSFDPAAETLQLKKAGFEVITIKLVESKVRTLVAVAGVSRPEARKYAFDLVASYLQSIREEFPERQVTVNPDLALMPEARRAQFLARKKQMEESGTFLTPFVLPDGRWGTALSGNEAANLPSEIRAGLTEADRKEINAAWALAKAESLARGIPPRFGKPAN